MEQVWGEMTSHDSQVYNTIWILNVDQVLCPLKVTTQLPDSTLSLSKRLLLHTSNSTQSGPQVYPSLSMVTVGTWLIVWYLATGYPLSPQHLSPGAEIKNLWLALFRIGSTLDLLAGSSFSHLHIWLSQSQWGKTPFRQIFGMKKSSSQKSGWR